MIFDVKKIEIERKFLLSAVPQELLNGVQGDLIKQGYLLREEDHELRIRKRNNSFWMTLKQGVGLSRSEQECSITEEQFEMLWPLTAGRQVEKVRYAVKQHDYLYEIDLFKGALAPLMFLEVEFDNLQASYEFKAPVFVDHEVTADENYKNATLAVSGLPESFKAISLIERAQ